VTSAQELADAIDVLDQCNAVVGGPRSEGLSVPRTTAVRVDRCQAVTD
jgi:hypothetical protein